ncbi:disease resistance protein [Salix suchowensis]|nr:disease resistance protein [Salix suchowensis]
MAEAVTSALASILLGNLNTGVLEELGRVFGLQTEFEKLKITFETVQAVLNDAEEKQWKDKAIRIWLQDLKDAAYDAEDVLDEFSIEAQRRRQRRGLKDRLRSFSSLDQNPLVFRFKMAHKLKNVRQKLDDIDMRKNKFKLTEGVGEKEADRFDWRITSSYVNKTEIIYGRDKEKEELISMLLANSDDLSVYAIHGMGGLGKTTLAQLVYSDASVEGRFDLRIWVCVSDDFDIRRLSRAIIESIEGERCTLEELDTLQRHLREKLIGRRFLLVLDDVWDHYHEKWNALKDALRVGAGGCAIIITTRCAIIITTRLKQVADTMATVPVHQMGRLSEDDSWLLFERHAFGARRREEREEYLHLESIGKAIVNKCNGLPLALKALGSLLRLKRSELEWLSVKESEIWNLPDEFGRILPALKLSYNNLPPHLKQCFGFCCLFPKDYVMKKDQLVKLWMANGFIDPEGQMDLHDPEGQMDLHETGYEIFDDLVGRSIFQEVEEDDFGNITCKMHDLMHDLAKSVMIEECYLIENKRHRIPKTARHMSFHHGSVCYYDKDRVKVQSLRSLISYKPDYWPAYQSKALPFKVSSHKKLRTLGLSNFWLKKKLTEPIGNLKHLRYLDVSRSHIRKLPESISSLQNLQTLNLSYCTLLYILPKKMKDMKSLIYLDLTRCDALQCMPSGMGQLGCLRKLGMFIVGKKVGHHIGELQRLNYIGGELSIKDLDNVQGLADAQNANLARKTNLHSLSLSWREDESSKFSEANSEDVLRALEPHSNMKKLEISGYRGSKFPDWMLESRLPNLVEISLQSCMNCEHLPPFGKLRFLKHLQLKRMDTVKCIGSEMYGDGENPFPSLERLFLGPMRNLEDWETNSMGGREIFTCLHVLQIEKCPKLVELPIIPSVKYLAIEDCTVTLLSSVVNFTSITSLQIEGFDELVVLPDGMLQNHTCLQKLSIQKMRSLRSLSNQLNNLSSLKSLSIIECDAVESLPDGVQNLNSLEMLCIFRMPKITALSVLPSSLATLVILLCEELTSLSEGLQNLTALKYLELTACVKLNSLPESIRHLNSLQSLTISCCPGVSCLPNQIRHLTSLSRMNIDGCSNLMSLPEGIRNLEMLRELVIEDCPNLERRCKKEKGKDWPNIAHIRTIIINNQLIQSSET